MSKVALRSVVSLLLAAGLWLGAAPGNAAPAASARPVLVLAGASGKTGREILQVAARNGWRVRALTRDVARARKDLGPAFRLAEWREVDLTDAAAAQAAVDGADHVVTALGAHTFQGQDVPDRVDFLANSRLIDAAVAAHVRHFVFVSSATSGTHRDQAKSTALMNVRFWKTRAEEQLRASGLHFTIIGPGGLTQEPARKLGLRILPREQYSSTDVSRADVARVALDALTNPSADGKSFALINDKSVAVDAWRAQLAEFPVDRPSGSETAAIDKLGWMAGHWSDKAEDGALTDEAWMSQAGGLMIGMNRHVPALKHGMFEFLRIETRPDGSTVFVGWPQGQPPTDFKLTSVSDTRVSFFNLAHDFPQGISYWREGEELHARVDGVDRGVIRSMEYRFKRHVPERAVRAH